MEGMKKIKSMLFHQYSWNSEVETTWISLIGWPHKTSNKYVLYGFKPGHRQNYPHMIYIQCNRSCAKTNKVSNGLKFGILPYSAYCILIKCVRLWVLRVWEGGYLFAVCLTNKRTFWDKTNDFNEYFEMFRKYPIFV